MIRAAGALTNHDPPISAHAVRVLLMAGAPATFLADFRQRPAGEALSLWPGAPGSLVARQAKIHNGAGNSNSNAARGRISLSYRTPRYDYRESTMQFGSNGYSISTKLSVYNQLLADTLLTALQGRVFRRVIGYNGTPTFFASRYTNIVAAKMSDFTGSVALDLVSSVKWHPLPCVLPDLW